MKGRLFKEVKEVEKRKWKPEEKLAIVLEGLRTETSIAELCRRHQISQSQFYKWRDQFLQGAKEYLEYGGNNKNISSPAENRRISEEVRRKNLSQAAEALPCLA